MTKTIPWPDTDEKPFIPPHIEIRNFTDRNGERFIAAAVLVSRSTIKGYLQLAALIAVFLYCLYTQRRQNEEFKEYLSHLSPQEAQQAEEERDQEYQDDRDY